MDQYTFTKIILGLYATNSIWLFYCGKYGPAGYWMCAAGITICATWFMK